MEEHRLQFSIGLLRQVASKPQGQHGDMESQGAQSQVQPIIHSAGKTETNEFGEEKEDQNEPLNQVTVNDYKDKSEEEKNVQYTEDAGITSESKDAGITSESEENDSNQELDIAVTKETKHQCPFCPKRTFDAHSAYVTHLYKTHRHDEQCPKFCWLCKCGFAFINSSRSERHPDAFIRIKATNSYNEKFPLQMQIADTTEAHETIFCFHDHVSCLQIAMNIYGENTFPFVFLANSSHNSRKTLIFRRYIAQMYCSHIISKQATFRNGL